MAGTLAHMHEWQTVLVMLAYVFALIAIAAFGIRRGRSRDTNGHIHLTWARIALLLFFLSSWSFILTSGLSILISNYTSNIFLCHFAQFTCILLYGASKVFVYLFLIEKVHIVWQSISGAPRLRSPVYLLCLASMIFYPPYIGIILAVRGYTGSVRTDGQCITGLRPAFSLSVIAYDIYLNVLLTALFLYPLMRGHLKNRLLRRVAHRTLLATVVALSVSTINILLIFLAHGRQRMWVCLGLCSLDIVVSAIAIYWTTSPAPLSAQRAQPGSGVYGTSPSFAFRPGSGSGAQCTTVVVATTGADDVVDVRKTLLDEDACESPVRAEGKGLPDGEWEEGRMVSVELPKVPPPAKALW